MAEFDKDVADALKEYDAKPGRASGNEATGGFAPDVQQLLQKYDTPAVVAQPGASTTETGEALPVPPIPPEVVPPAMGPSNVAANALGGDQFIPNAQAANPSQSVYSRLRNALEPDPNYVYSKDAPIAMDAQGKPHLAVPLREHEWAQGLLDAAYGVGTAADQVRPALTPEATGALATTMMGNRSPAYIPDRFSMGLPSNGNPLNAMRSAEITGINTPASRTGFASRNALEALPPRELTAEGQAAPRTLDIDPTTGQAVPLGTPPSGSLTPASTVPFVPTASADAEKIAGQYYKQADQLGGQLTPTYANNVVDQMQAIPNQTREAIATGKPDEATAMAQRLDALRDQPITFEGAQGIDKNFSKSIGTELRAGNKESASDLMKMRDTFRDALTGAGPDDVVGGTEGFQALVPARQAWSQAMKMRDLEAIQDRASLTDNPATGIKSGIRTLLSNPNRVRGYTPDEIAALKDAGDRGFIGGALHVLGNRLTPNFAALSSGIGTGMVDPLSGAIVGSLAWGASHALGASARAGASAIQRSRMTNALSTLGKSVPPPLSGPGAQNYSPW